MATIFGRSITMRVSRSTPPLPSSTVLAAITMRWFRAGDREEMLSARALALTRAHRKIFVDRKQDRGEPGEKLRLRGIGKFTHLLSVAGEHHQRKEREA